MQQTDKLTVARTLKECVGYLLKDCEDAGFSTAAVHLRIAVQELQAMMPADETCEKQRAARN